MGVNSPNSKPATAAVNFQVNTMNTIAVITAIAAVLLALFTLIGLVAPIYSRLGHLEAEIMYSRELADARHQETLEEIRHLTEALISHRHSPDGDVIFTVPPPRTDAQPNQSNPDAATIPPQSGANPTQTPTPQEPK